MVDMTRARVILVYLVGEQQVLISVSVQVGKGWDGFRANIDLRDVLSRSELKSLWGGFQKVEVLCGGACGPEGAA